MKPTPNRARYLDVLRRMTPEQRLMKAIELTELGRTLLREGLRSRFPEASAEELKRLYFERLDRCRNRNY